MLTWTRLLATTAALGMILAFLVACANSPDGSDGDLTEATDPERAASDAVARQQPGAGEGSQVRERVTIGYAHWGANLAESLDTLVASKTDIVVGRVIGADNGRVVPFTDEPAAETPPPDHPKAKAATPNADDPDVGIPWTNYSVEIVIVIRSAAIKERDIITISQEGGLIDGVAYELEGDRVILVGATEIFFIREAAPGVYVVAPFMRFPLDQIGRLQPVDVEWSDLPAVKALTGLTLSEAESRLLTAIADAAP